MKWKQPPIIKVYEALGSVADKRLEIEGNSAKVYSSTGNKFYEVKYDPETHSIMANDNGSYWKGYLGYPSIAFLLATGVLEYRPEMGNLLQGIAWKDINQQFKNDFDQTLEHILAPLKAEQRETLGKYVEVIYDKLVKLDLNLLGKRVLPPQGY